MCDVMGRTHSQQSS